MVDVTGNCYLEDFFTVYFSTITMLVEKSDKASQSQAKACGSANVVNLFATLARQWMQRHVAVWKENKEKRVSKKKHIKYAKVFSERTRDAEMH